MMEFLQFISQDTEHFLGFLIVGSALLTFVLRLVNRVMRHANIRKHGWPPAHIDADGDHKDE